MTTVGGGSHDGGAAAPVDIGARIDAWFRAPLFVAALLAIPVIVVRESDPGGPWGVVAATLDWAIWAAFASQLVVGLLLVPNRRRWVLDHPLEVLIVVLTPPFLPATFKVARALPVVRLIWLLLLTRNARTFFSARGLRFVALIAFTIVIVGGTIFPLVEGRQDLTIWDGLWWATETVTTVAYGDIYPVTAAGRIVATVVMTTGIGFVALLTGSLAQRFLHGGDTSPRQAPSQEEILQQIDALTRQTSELRQALEGGNTKGSQPH